MVIFVCCTAIIQAQKPPTKNTNNNTIVPDSVQKLPYKIVGIARATGDSVILRWSPSTVGMWLALSTSGVIIERFEMDTTKKQLSKEQRLTPTPIRAWDSLQWKSSIRSLKPNDNQMLLLAAQCLLGEWNVPTTTSIESFRNAVGNQGNKFTFAMLAADNNPLAAEGLGLRFVDKSAKRGATYIYRIYPSNDEKIYRDTAIILCVNTPYISTTSPMNLRAEEREGKVLLQWDAMQGAKFSGYYIYRQATGEKENKLNSHPIFTLVQSGKQTYTNSFEDTSAGYYIPYTYRVRGVDMFGSESRAAEIVAMGRDRTPPPPPNVKKPFAYIGNSVLLEWEMNVPTADLAGFIVMKSDSATSRYYPLHKDYLPKTATQFVDTAANEDEPYYTVIAIDTAGNSSSLQMVYAEMRDTIPPNTPQGVRGTIDTNGVVRISWNLGHEKDLLGYRVLWANQRDHEFTQKSNLILLDTVFTDTILIKTLTPHVYYKVVAVDTRYLHSDPTDIIELKRPDIVPPETPLIRKVVVEPKAVHLQLVPSTSKDVKEHQLQRRIVGETSWINYAQLSATVTAYSDTSVEQNTMYEYQLVAIDSSNLYSLPSPSVVGRPYDTGVRPMVENLLCVYDSAANSVKITWDYPYKPLEKYWFVVYRAYDENNLNQLAAVRPENTEFIDTKLFGYGRYRYAIRMISERGESPISDESIVMVTR
jgi:fibronectin type 3 domain-containing protein